MKYTRRDAAKNLTVVLPVAQVVSANCIMKVAISFGNYKVCGLCMVDAIHSTV